MTGSNPKKFWAGGFLYNSATRYILLHKRDGNTKINPNKWAFFGGLNEGDETPTQCFVREVYEELNLALAEKDVMPLCDYLNIELSTYRYVFYVESNVSKDKLTLSEGAGFDWIPIQNIGAYDLTEKTRLDLDTFLRLVL